MGGKIDLKMIFPYLKRMNVTFVDIQDTLI